MSSRFFEKFSFIILVFSLLFLTGCNLQPTDEDGYFYGIALKNIDDNTPTDYSFSDSDYGIYTTLYNLPGLNPSYYQSILFFMSEHDGSASTHTLVASPITQTLNIFQIPSSFWGNFLLDREVMINYLEGNDCTQWYLNVGSGRESIYGGEINSISEENKEYSFGGPYTPTSFYFNESNPQELALRKDSLISGKNTILDKKTFWNFDSCYDDNEEHIFELETPGVELYKNGILMDKGNLTSKSYYEGKKTEEYWNTNLWGALDENTYFNYGETKATYLVNLTIPLYYPIFNKTNVVAEFVYPQEDHSPPWLDNLDTPVNFVSGEEYLFTFGAYDETGLSSVSAWYSLDSGVWIPLALDNPGSAYIGRFTPESGTRLNLKIFISDSSFNNQTYTIYPVALERSDLIIEINQEPSIVSPGTLVHFSGKITDLDGNAVSNLLIREFYNGNEIGKAYTSQSDYIYNLESEEYDLYYAGGEFSFDIDVPANYNPSEDDYSLIFGGTGRYSDKTYVIGQGFQTFETDLAVTNIVVPQPYYLGENTIGVSVANVGGNSAEAQLNLYYVDSDGNGEELSDRILLNSSKINLDSGEEKGIDLSVFLNQGEYSGYNTYFKFVAEIVYGEDENVANNQRSFLTRTFSLYDASAEIGDLEDYYLINQVVNVPFEITNTGLRDLVNVSWTLSLNRDTEEVICNGTISSLKVREIYSNNCDFSVEEYGWFELKLEVNVSGDTNYPNSIDGRWIEIKQDGADLDSWFNSYRFLVREENFLEVEVYNSGTEDVSNGNFSLYYQKDYCDSEYGECNNFTLIDSRLFNLQKNSGFNFNVSWTPDESGYFTLIFIVNASNQVEYGENVRRRSIRVQERGPDVLVYSPYLYGQDFFVGENYTFDAEIANYGTDASGEINVSFYSFNYGKDEDESFFLIESKTISSLDSEEKVFVSFNFSPTETGNFQYLLNVSSEGDVDLTNNNANFGVLVKKNAIDFSLDNLWYYNLNLNDPSRIYVSYSNLGLSFEEPTNGTLNFYLDDELIQSLGTELSNSWGDNSFSKDLELIFTSVGEHILKVELIVDGDTDLTNNVLETSIRVYALRNVSFNIYDSLNVPVEKYLFVDGAYSGNDVPIKGNNFTWEVSESESIHYYLLDSFDPSGKGETYFELYFSDIFESSYNLVLEEYDSLIQDGTNFYYVVAGYSNRETLSNGYILSKPVEDLESLGLSSEEIENLDVYSCEDFDFVNRKCSVPWGLSSNVDFYLSGHDSRVGIQAGSSFAVEAFALSLGEPLDGDSTDLGSVSGNVRDFTLEKSKYAKIKFNEEVNVDGLTNDFLKRTVRISPNLVSINTNEYKYEFFKDVSAEITFRNVVMHNPQILRNGVPCNSSYCSDIYYNSENKTLTLNVSGFSEYRVIEGPYCGNGIVENGETCNVCVADAGICPSAPPSGGSSGGGGSSRTIKKCIPDWSNCYWSLCVNHVQSLLCIDSNYCGSLVGKPSDSKACLVESNCVDPDGDGYGTGPDCLGLDVSEGDPALTDSSLKKVLFESSSGLKWALYIAFGLILILVIIVFILFSKMKKKGDEKDSFKIETPVNDVLYNYLSEYSKKYPLEELKKKILSKGYSESELNAALKKLGFSN